MLRFHKYAFASLFASVLFLPACGGGGGGGGGSASSGRTTLIAPAVTPSAAFDYTPGVFAAPSTYKDQCQSPRPGTDDKSGSVTTENAWLRTWSNRTYLWYNEITDLNPASYNDREVYFETQKTFATTASGAPKDKFHFTVPTDEYEQSVSTGAALGYGAYFKLIRASAPREVRVAYVQPGSPADTAGIVRGMSVTAIDGVAVSNGNAATLNAGLFPALAGERHTFTVRAPGASASADISLRAAVVTEDPVLKTEIISPAGDPSKTVGYMLFNTFGTASAEKALFDSFTDFKAQNVNELVLDLRYNGGGFLDIAAQLGFMIAGDANTNGRTFEKIQFNDKFPATNPVTGGRLEPTLFVDESLDFSVDPDTPLPSLDLARVYILSTDDTCSASEALINGLTGVDFEVVLIGGQTCGKPYGFYATDNCGLTYFTIQFVGVNEKSFGDYTDGFTPGPNPGGAVIKGCSVGDDYSDPLGSRNEAMLSTALTHIETGSCPPAPLAAGGLRAKKKIIAGAPETSLYNSPRVQARRLLKQSRLSRPRHD